MVAWEDEFVIEICLQIVVPDPILSDNILQIE